MLVRRVKAPQSDAALMTMSPQTGADVKIDSQGVEIDFRSLDDALTSAEKLRPNRSSRFLNKYNYIIIVIVTVDN